MTDRPVEERRSAAGIVLLTLASAQFLMTLDTSVMNVSIAQVAEDVGTTITGIQTAITLYTLVMATLMITGGKIGSLLGRRKAFAIGCVIYGVGSLTTSLAPNLAVLIVGWSFLEGIGAALIMPAIVALVASNFPPEGRPRAYGLVASAGAIAVAAGPLIGGVVTTTWTWRFVFAGEVVIVLGILALTRRMHDTPPEGRFRLDLVGVILSATGLGIAVFGVLRSGVWGWVQPKPGGPSWLGVSPTLWLIVVGLLIVRVFFAWEDHVAEAGGEPLVRTSMLRNPRLVGGLTMFFIQYLIQAGMFFVIPLFLSVSLGLTAAATGARLMPLSITLLLAAVGIPRFRPRASPRVVVRWGLVGLLAGIVALIGALELGAGPEIVTVPLLLAGFGIGALASQLGAVTVSSVSDELSGEVGGLQNTLTNLGASLGTALAGSILIASLTMAFVQGIEENPAVPPQISSQAGVELAAGVPFVSDAQLEDALHDAGIQDPEAQAIVDENGKARILALRASLAVLAIAALVALFLTRMIPIEPVGGSSIDQEGPEGRHRPDRRRVTDESSRDRSSQFAATTPEWEAGSRKEARMNLNGILIGSEDPKRLAEYYTKLFGEPGWDDGGYTGWLIGTGGVTVGPHSEVKGKNDSPGRIIWNIESPDVKGDFDRLKAAGATVVREPYTPEGAPEDQGEMLIATFADPDDNYFQLISPM